LLVIFSKLLSKFKKVHWDDNHKIYPTYSADDYDRKTIELEDYNKSVKYKTISNYFNLYK